MELTGKTNFRTVLYTLKSPHNVGMIVRSHVAHGGDQIIFTGDDTPWKFKKRSQSFSRKLEKQTRICHIPDPEKAVAFLHGKGYTIVAIEISENAVPICDFRFPEKVALVVGNEGTVLPLEFLKI